MFSIERESHDFLHFLPPAPRRYPPSNALMPPLLSLTASFIYHCYVCVCVFASMHRYKIIITFESVLWFVYLWFQNADHSASDNQ